MNQIKSLFVLLVAALALLPACGQEAVDEIGFGTVEGSAYKNEYFGLTVAVPADWNIQEQEARDELMSAGGELVAGEDKNLKAALKASEMSTVNLFAAFKYPLGSPVDFNANFMCLAERLDNAPGIKSGQDYLFHSRKLLESSQIDVSVSDEKLSEMLGGQSFDVMQTKTSMRGLNIRQKYYATIMNGYALVFILTFTEDEDESSLQDILKTVAFG